MSKLLYYTAASVAAVAIAIANGYKLHQQFYHLAIYLSSHQASLIVLLNAFLVAIFWVSKAAFRLCFGPLRVLEVEHLYERGWFAVSESALAMTIFRNEIGSLFLILFAILLAVKCMHWVLSDRIDLCDQIGSLREKPWPQVAKLLAIAVVLGLTNAAFIAHANTKYKTEGVSMISMFGFEYVLLSLYLFKSVGKLICSVYEQTGMHGEAHDDDEWEHKGMALLYLNLVVDFGKLVAYLVFFVMIMTSYGLPIHIIRDVYLTCKSFFDRVGELIRYRRAVANLRGILADVTVQDLNGDITCIICREDITHEEVAVGGERRRETAKKLNCGHLFHYKCLRSWLERQQSCPTCRRSVFDPAPVQEVTGVLGEDGVIRYGNQFRLVPLDQLGSRPTSASTPSQSRFNEGPSQSAQSTSQAPLPSQTQSQSSQGQSKGKDRMGTDLSEMTEHQLEMLLSNTKEGLRERVKLLKEVAEEADRVAKKTQQLLDVLQ